MSKAVKQRKELKRLTGIYIERRLERIEKKVEIQRSKDPVAFDLRKSFQASLANRPLGNY